MDNPCHVETIQKNATPEEKQSAYLVILAVQGMGCPNCAARVHNGLIQVNGVVAALVDHNYGAAQVIFNPNLTTQEALIDAVAQAGGDGRHEYRAWVFAEPRLLQSWNASSLIG